MRKLRMEIEDLVVESFDTGGAAGRSGTVNGHFEEGEFLADSAATCGCPLKPEATRTCPDPTFRGATTCYVTYPCTCTI